MVAKWNPLLKLSRKDDNRVEGDKNVMQYCTNVCSVLQVNTTVSDFKLLFEFFLSEYFRKHDRVSVNPNQGTPLTLARLWPSTKTPFEERFIVVRL